MVTTHHTAHMPVRARRGRKYHEADTEIGRVIRLRMGEIGITQKELARRLRISQARLHNIIHGKVRSSRPLSEAAWCDALEFGMDLGTADAGQGFSRRAFLSRAKAAGVLAAGALLRVDLGLHEKRPRLGPQLEMADSFAHWLETALDAGTAEADGVRREAERWFDQLLGASARPSQEELARVQIRWGTLLVRAQQASLPWWRRARPILQTCERVEHVVRSFPLNMFAREHAWLLGRHVQMYRELDQFAPSVQAADDALAMLRGVDDTALEILILLDRAHSWVAMGKIADWKRDLDSGRVLAQRQAGERRERFAALADYFEAEGRKRIAENIHLNLPGSVRRRNAQDAYSWLQTSRSAVGWFQAYAPHEGAGRMLIHQVSEAQCLRWIDAREAMQRFGQLRVEAAAHYPSLVEKVDASVATLKRMVPGL